MKKFLLLGFVLFTSLKLFAQTSNVIVFSEQGEPFWLVVNGVKQNADPQTNVKVTGLNAPSYKVKVIFKNNTLPDLDKTIYLMDGGNPVVGEWTYDVKKNNKNEYVLRESSYVPIAQAAPPAPNQQVIVFGVPAVTAVVTTPVTGTVTQQTTTTTTTGDPNAVNMNMSVGGVGVGVNMNVTGANMTGTSTTTTTTTTSGNMGGTTVVSGPAAGCAYAMAPSDFEGAKNTISAESFDETKLKIAKQVVGSNCVNAQQVKDIMGLFSFEQSKLDFAKYAYAYTVDKGNYFKVNDAFTFSASKDELTNYISGH